MNLSLFRKPHPALHRTTNQPIPVSRSLSCHYYLRNLVARSLLGGTTGSITRSTGGTPVTPGFLVIYILVIGISLGFRVYNLEFRHVALIRA